METGYDDLMAALRRLPDLSPIARAQLARELSDVAKTVLSAVGDAAVVDALAGKTYEQVAAELGVSSASVNKAVTRHRHRINSAVTS